MTAHRIVIVEDDAPTMEMLRDASGIAGYSVESMTSGRDACERLWTTLPDAILLDLWMETSTAGEMVLALLELDHRTKDIPVIVISAHVQALRDQHSNMIERGHLLLQKPFSLDELFGNLSAAIACRKEHGPLGMGGVHDA